MMRLKEFAKLCQKLDERVSYACISNALKMGVLFQYHNLQFVILFHNFILFDYMYQYFKVVSQLFMMLVRLQLVLKWKTDLIADVSVNDRDKLLCDSLFKIL